MSLPKPSSSTHVVVTGASSGIGKELSRVFASRGHNLAIVARRKELLDELAGELSGAHGVEVAVFVRDLGDPDQRESLITELNAHEKSTAGLCNNAGFGTSGRFWENNGKRERDEVDLNVASVVHMTHGVLEGMVDRREGAILNTGSTAGFQPIPGMATYAASKAFVNSWSEAVHEELHGTGVSCTVLCPGPVETEWMEISGAESLLQIPGAKVSPKEIAKQSVDAMEAGRRTVVPGLVPKVMSVAGRFTPRTILLPTMNRVFGNSFGSD